MNTITKEDIIEATVDYNIYPDIIINYCLEHNKEVQLTNKFIIVLLSNPVLLDKCYNIALNYYQEKYNITMVKDKQGIIILAY